MGKQYTQTTITYFIQKNKSIKKENLNSTKDSQDENQSIFTQLSVKIQQTKLKIVHKVFDIKILPQSQNQRNQEIRPIRYGQLLLTQLGIRTTGNQMPFHKICTECGFKLTNHKSQQFGRGPVCQKKNIARKRKF